MSEPLTLSRQYTAKDFTALRAFVQRIEPATIARMYFDPDEDPHAATPSAMERYLREMLDALVTLAIEHGSPVLASHLKASLRKHGSAKLTAVTLKMVEDAAKLAVAAPAAEHGIGMWFRPMVGHYLKQQGVSTLGELIDLCNRRGGTWWRSVPRVGAGRAKTIVRWLRQHERTIGQRVADDVDLAEPLKLRDEEIVIVGRDPRVLAPLERMALRQELSGVSGANRSPAFCFVSARHDLEAVRAYLTRYRDNPKTLRSYTKELERFVLWAVCVRGKALSSLLVDDCEAYKDFLQAPSPAFVGARTSRGSDRWRPFASAELTAESQKYAVRALRAAFTWLVDVRYLAGNPWKAVRDPATVTRETEIHVDKALASGLWERVQGFLAEQSEAPDAGQWRTARALLLLMGDSGLRREEAAYALRGALKISSHSQRLEPTYELKIIGKRQRERTVPVSPATIAALNAHWADRGLDFELIPDQPTYLLSPLIVPRTKRSMEKYADSDIPKPYSVRGLGTLVRWATKQMEAQMDHLSERDRIQLFNASPHAFRHTFGTQAAAENVPLDVIQKALGHQSMQTTSIYVQAERRRLVQSLERYYARPNSDRDVEQ